MHFITKTAAIDNSARNNSWSLTISQPILVFGQSKNVR